MAIFLAGKNLLQNKVRTLVAVAGVCFAVTLLFMQLGFFAAVSKTATLVYDALDFDLVLASPNYVMLTKADSFPQRRLAQARGCAEVERVMPVYVGRTLWRNPEKRFYRGLVLIGVRPTDPVSLNEELAAELPELARPNTVLIDRFSRAEVGPQDVGLVNEVGPTNLTTVGQFTIGPGFEAGVIVVGDQTFARLTGRPLDDVSLGLVKLRPGADADAVAAELRQSLPADVRVLTRQELNRSETEFWVVSTSTGIIFGSGVLVALLFGVVIIYQVLSMEVTHRLPEYATLKAMGYDDRYLAWVVVQQALVFAVVSYVPGFIFALVIYWIGTGLTKLPVGMTWERAVGVFAANLVLCAVSGVLALRMLRRADPVDLF